MLSPGQVLQDLLLNDPGHAGAAAREDGRRVTVASSAVKRRPLTSPRRGGRMRPPWRSPAPSRLSELRRDPTHPRGTAAASPERRADSSPLARLPAARGARGQGWGARRRGRARRGAGRAATDGRARGHRLGPAVGSAEAGPKGFALRCPRLTLRKSPRSAGERRRVCDFLQEFAGKLRSSLSASHSFPSHIHSFVEPQLTTPGIGGE